MSRVTAQLIPDSHGTAGAAVDPAPANTGNGTVTGISAQAGSTPEVWTLTCIATAANGGTFSVFGSVSGPQANAVVGGAYNNGKIAFTINDGAVDFILGDNFTITVSNAYGAQFSGNANRTALERATEITLYGGTAAAVVEVLDPNGTNWRASGATIAASGLTHISSPPVCIGIRVAGETPNATPPVRILVRHDVD